METEDRDEEFKPQVGDQAVRAKTGRGWEEWFSILDQAGGQEMSHKELVVHLQENYQVEPWWQQMVAVTYEQSRGLREKHQAASGYQTSLSKTVPVPARVLFSAWTVESQREKWLPGAPIQITKATEDKSVRMRWADQSRLEVYIYEKGEQKSQANIQHSQLESRQQVDEMKAYWREALGRLAAFLAA
jgi:hypothetical protein